MRKCVRCNADMVEGCGISVKGSMWKLVLVDDENRLFGGRLGTPKVAICPECGEVSMYLENAEELNRRL